MPPQTQDAASPPPQQQPQRVEFEGTTHEFPADFTNADISKALASYKPAKSAGGMTPPPAARPGAFQTMPGGKIYNVKTLGDQAIQYPSMEAAVSGSKARVQLPDYPQQVEKSKKRGAEMMPGVGAAIGGELGGVPGMAAGAALGELGKPLMTGGKPKYGQAAVEGAATYAGGKLFEYGLQYAADLIRPFITKAAEPVAEAALQKGVQSHVTELGNMAKAEEGVRAAVTAAPRLIRKNIINPLYPVIDEPVDIYAPAKAAVKGAKGMIAHGSPAELSRTTAIGRSIERIEGTVKELVAQDRSLGSDPMQQAELLDTLQALKDRREIPFRKAQELRSALGRAIAKGQGYKLPAEVYNDLSNVRNLLDSGMRDTAEAAGKLDQWDKAQAVYSQFMKDFYDKNAPLKGVLDLRQGMTGSTYRRLTQPQNALRAEQAMRRWGMDSAAEALAKVRNMPDRVKAIKEMEEALTAPEGFPKAKLAEAREASEAGAAASKAELAKAREERLKKLKLFGAAGGAAYWWLHRGDEEP